MANKMNGRVDMSDSATTWERMPFQVSIGQEFRSVGEVYLDLLDVDENGQIRYTEGNPNGKVGNSSANDYEQLRNFLMLPRYGQLSDGYYKDTRLGANDAINCLWQFNRDDDIVHPVAYSDIKVKGIGMGRVYGSTIDQNQTIAWFTMGVPKFTGVTEFYKNAFKAELIELNNTGFSALTLGKMLGNTLGLAFTFVSAPFRWVVNFALRLRSFNVNRFYDLRTTMHLYYKYVDAMLTSWLVDAGFFKVADGEEDANNGWTADPTTMPIALQETGPSIWNIMARKASSLRKRDKKGGDGVTSGLAANLNDPTAFETEMRRMVNMTPDNYDNATGADTQIWSGTTDGHGVDWTSLFWESAMGATQFVGFRVEKSTDASESFSNSTEQSRLAQQINSKSAEMRATFFDLGGQSMADTQTGVGALDGLIHAGAGLAQSVMSAIGAGDTVAAVTGGAFIDIPERYSGSDFNKSHSLAFQLRSPNGDKTSIYQSIIVPLSMLLAMVLPHAAGPNSYQQPFLVRVFCKGMFSIPLGIVDSLSIKRGSSEFGWTYDNLPTCVDVNMSIKDLSPAMYMGIKDNTFSELIGANTTFDEYMLTLAGVGAFERLSQFDTFQRRVLSNAHRIRNTIFSKMAWADYFANLSPVQFVSSFFANRLPHN